MERRSRSQTRRAGEGFVPGPQGAAGGPGGRHASSGRLPETSHGQLSLPYSRPPEQARTLSPDRRDRYRASYREGQVTGGPTSMPGGQYPTSNSVPHSNSNSYNQYNQSYNLNPRYVTGAEAPPRPLPPSSGAGGYAAPNNAPPRPDPPSSNNPYNSTSPNVSPSKASSNLVSQDKAGSGQQQGLPPHQVSLIFPGI